MKNPHGIIKLLILLAYASVLLALGISIIPAYFLMQAVPGGWGAVLFGLCVVLCGAGLSCLAFWGFGKLIQRQNNGRGSLVCIHTDGFSRSKFIKNNNMAYVHEGVFSMALPGKTLRTLGLFILQPETSPFDLKRMQKLQRDHVLDKYPQGKKHWPLRLQVLVLENVPMEDFRSTLPQDGEQMYTKGQIRCLYDTKNKKLYLPVFPGRRMDLRALLNFEQTIHILSQLMQAKKIQEV